MQALSELAKRKCSDPVPIGELAESRGIPVQFLEQLFSLMRRAGILSSQRGVKGGYTFTKSPDKVTVLEIVEALDGPVGADSEGASEVFVDAAKVLRTFLAGVTIAEVAEREGDSASSMYYI